MSQDPIWITKDGRAMARCPDCNLVQECKKGTEQIIEVGPKGQVSGVICDSCWERHKRSGARTK